MKLKLFIAAIVAIACVVIALRVRGGAEEESCKKILSQYGWETEEGYTNKAAVNIPSEFDTIYNNYNILQKEAGLDLLPFRGKNGERYTFIVTNYPLDTGETVYANVIVVDSIPVAGDIMTVSVRGFMHSLKMPSF